jgi:hypothetical protein
MHIAQAEFDQFSTDPPLVDPFESVYRHYVVRYKPQPTPDGRFLAYVIILRSMTRMHTEAALTPDGPSFASQIDAARAGLEAGKRWIDHNGL